MNFSMIFKVAILAILRNKTRALLTCLGIIVGIAAVIAVLAIGKGASTMMLNEISTMGNNLMMIWPDWNRRGQVRSGMGAGQTMTADDAEAIQQELGHLVKYVSPAVNVSSQLIYQNKNWSCRISGVSCDMPEIRNWTVGEGRFFTEEEQKGYARVCVIGTTVQRNLFQDEEDPIGRTIRIGAMPFKIVGVLRSKGANGWGQDQDDTVMAPYTTVGRVLTRSKFRSINMMNLSLVIRDPKQKDNLLALNVINDHSGTEALEQQGKRYLERAAKITASAGVELKCISRYDLNIAAGIIHTAKEHGATDVIIGLHWKVNIVDSFFGMLTESLLKGLHREVMVARFLIPINTLRRIIVAVPPKAEYEAGFQKWVDHFCRMGTTLGCRVHFFANEQTGNLLQGLVKKKHSNTLTEFSRLDEWEDLLLLTGQVNYDHLLVVISARRGSISYDSSFEKLPSQLGRYFTNNSLIVLYPDQLGDPQDALSFSNPQGSNESQHYEKVGRWFYKWFKKEN